MLQPGLMMDRPLLISAIIEHAAAQYANVDVVSRETHGPVFRYTWSGCAKRSRKLANALASLGLGPGSAVGSIAWNNHRHLEAYFAVSGSGMVMHTCNPRLQPQQLIYVINHAEDAAVIFDATFAPAIEGVDVVVYEDLVAPHAETFDWPDFDEHTGAALCYTSGTTGNPKGVLYSHRAMVLNALTGALPGVMGLSPSETVLPVVPMFHINAWCIPYGAPMVGARLVLPGPGLDGASLHGLFESEKVTVSAGVPTIWLGLMQYVEQNGLTFSTMKRTLVGGTAMPAALIAKFADGHGVEVRHGWGMTETTAAATFGALTPEERELPAEAQHQVVAKQGKSLHGVDIKVVDEAGNTLPRDGTSQGELMVRGHWIVERYYKADETALRDGWFPTGDIATIDADGRMQIRDRTKDVIKSGGEWISSIDLENAAMGHPAVAMAAVIGVKHEKWDERPLLFIVRKPDQALEKEQILGFLRERVADWWVPDDVVFVDSLPVGGTGKVQKTELRQQYGGVFT